MVHRADRRIGVGGEVNPSEMSRESNEGANQARILMRVPIVLLSPQGARFDISQTCNVASPLGLDRHLHELGVLLHHGLDYAQKADSVSMLRA